MKYFLKKLWQDIHHPDPIIRENANSQWVQNSQRYHEYFRTIQHRLPKRFRTAYQLHHGFHDYPIKGISFSAKKGVSTCILQLWDGARPLYLRLSGIRSVHVDIPTFENCLLSGLSWGYDEFEVTGDGALQLSLLCDMECELNFTFDKISLD